MRRTFECTECDFRGELVSLDVAKPITEAEVQRYVDEGGCPKCWAPIVLVDEFGAAEQARPRT